MRRGRVRTRVLWIALALAALGIVVLAARLILATAAGAAFVERYPGSVAGMPGTPAGIPAWLAWQHGLNAFFMVMIVRTGWLVRTVSKPAAYWTRHNRKPLRTKRVPKKISLDLWLHLSLDALWVLNGLAFLVLIFVTGQWARIVPTSWGVLPNALSAALQYAAFDWPADNGWVSYNALQLLVYCTVVFVLAPLAVLSGLRMSAAWPQNTRRLNRLYPLEAARALHFPVMLGFVVFAVVHVALVLATGAVRNLEHMFAASDSGGWTGVVLFGVWILVVAGAWAAARPLILRPLAQLTGTLSR